MVQLNPTSTPCAASPFSLFVLFGEKRTRLRKRWAMNWKFILCKAIMAASLSSVHAADISRDVREGRADESIHSSGYIEATADFSYDDTPVVGADRYRINFTIGGHYRYKRFFIDALAESYNQFQFGLNAYSGPSWSIDTFIAANDNGIADQLNDELDSFADRDPGLNFGLRATGYTGAYITQFEAMNDISGTHDGFLFTASFARNWLHKNWNFHALLGARYQSQEALDYLFGIDADEASERFPAYEAGAGTTCVTEFGATYPIAENWVFRSTARWWEYPSSVVDSPFITDDSFLIFSNSITFVY